MRYQLAFCSLAMALVTFNVAGAIPLQGRVADTEGAAIQSAFVLAYDDQVRVTPNTPLPVQTAISTDEGRFSLDLKPGFYDICVFSSAFAPACKKLHVTEESAHSPYNILMSVDPLIMVERGDKVTGK